MAWPLAVRLGWWAATKIMARRTATTSVQSAMSGRPALTAAEELTLAIQTAEMAKKLIDEMDDETDATCPTGECKNQDKQKPECEDKAKEIRIRRNELEQRNIDLYIDKYDLFSEHYNTRHPIYGSWNGHIKQFKDKQKSLRKLLAEYRKMGCPEHGKPDDADQWGSRQPISKPKDRK